MRHGGAPEVAAELMLAPSFRSSTFIAFVPSSLLSVSIYPAFDLHAIIIMYLSPCIFFTICIQLLLIFLFTCINQLGTYFCLTSLASHEGSFYST